MRLGEVQPTNDLKFHKGTGWEREEIIFDNTEIKEKVNANKTHDTETKENVEANKTHSVA